MQHFEYSSVKTVEEAAAFLAEWGERCKLIAGGTDLIPALRNEDIHPDAVLNLLEIESLKGIRETGDGVWIGSTTTFTDLEKSEILHRCFPLLCQAASSVGGPQIRNRGTIGGNIANASPAADVLPAVLALDGKAHVFSKARGEKIVSLEELIEKPYRITLQADELLTGLSLPKLGEGTQTGFEKLGRRNALARARMNLSLVLHQSKDGRVSEVRIVPGAVMPVARRMRRAEEALLGERPDAARIESAARRLIEEMTEVTGRRWSTEYKVPVMGNLFRRLCKSMVQG